MVATWLCTVLLDGSARLNLASFVTTWMEPQARTLMAECVDENMIDKDEYPQTVELERRCVAILADLWNAPSPDQATGCSTSGSSGEACMVAGMALQRRSAARVNDRARRPNLVMGANVQVCWEKFCRYWDVRSPLSGTHPPGWVDLAFLRWIWNFRRHSLPRIVDTLAATPHPPPVVRLVSRRQIRMWFDRL